MKRYAGHQFRCLIMLLCAENRRHALAAGLHRDDIICADQIKMGVLAHSCGCPGYSTFIANMVASIAYKEPDDEGVQTKSIWNKLYQKIVKHANQNASTNIAYQNELTREYLEVGYLDIYILHHEKVLSPKNILFRIAIS